MNAIQCAVAFISRAGGALGSLATIICLGLVAWSVVARYVFSAPQPWIDHMAGWLVLALVLLGAPEAQRRFEHIGVDVAIGRIGPRAARFVHLLGVLSVATVAVVLLMAGLEAVEFSRMVGLMTDIEGVPEWWIQSLLPIGAALMLLVSLAQALALVLGREPPYLPSGKEELPRDTLARGE